MEEILGLSASVLTVVGTAGVAVWFCCSMLERVVRTSRRLERTRHDRLLKENRRLKQLLTEAEEENTKLRAVCHAERFRRRGATGERAA